MPGRKKGGGSGIAPFDTGTGGVLKLSGYWKPIGGNLFYRETDFNFDILPIVEVARLPWTKKEQRMEKRRETIRRSSEPQTIEFGKE